MRVIACQLVGLVTLYVVSSQHAGIIPVAARYHQLRKYGPNAVLAVNIALWVEAERRAKQMAMWKSLCQLAALSTEALAVDYFSQTNAAVVLSAAKKRHWCAALASFATLLLQATAVVSTSLLERRPQPLAYSVHDLATAASFLPSVKIPRISQILNQ